MRETITLNHLLSAFVPFEFPFPSHKLELVPAEEYKHEMGDVVWYSKCEKPTYGTPSKHEKEGSKQFIMPCCTDGDTHLYHFFIPTVNEG